MDDQGILDQIVKCGKKDMCVCNASAFLGQYRAWIYPEVGGLPRGGVAITKVEPEHSVIRTTGLPRGTRRGDFLVIEEWVSGEATA